MNSRWAEEGRKEGRKEGKEGREGGREEGREGRVQRAGIGFVLVLVPGVVMGGA